MKGMVKEIDDKIFEEMWNKSSEEDLSEVQKFWDYRAEEFNKNKPQKDAMEKNALIQFIVSKCGINKEFSVLDIGCGAGKYLLEFAKIAGSVEGIDISPEMLKYTAQNVKNAGLKNVKLKCIPWQSLDIHKLKWNNKFDIVFASMSPAINSKKALLKMIESSKRYCFMSGFVYRKDSIKDKLIQSITGKKNDEKFSNNIYCAFNILWNMGIYPEITYRDLVWNKKWDSEKAAEVYTMEIERTFKDDKLHEKVKDYIESISCEGKFEETTQAKTAWMIWKV